MTSLERRLTAPAMTAACGGGSECLRHGEKHGPGATHSPGQHTTMSTLCELATRIPTAARLPSTACDTPTEILPSLSSLVPGPRKPLNLRLLGAKKTHSQEASLQHLLLFCRHLLLATVREQIPSKGSLSLAFSSSVYVLQAEQCFRQAGAL